MNRVTSWQAIRALRAAPTGAAADDVDRRRTFVASLRQAEELAEAADTASYASRPLLIFYSLSQAGRAIAAAQLSGSWVLRGHGLRVNIDASNRLLDTVVEPTGRGGDSFSGVAAALGSPGLYGATQLGALWAANPDLRDVPIPADLGQWPPALEIPIGVQCLPLTVEETDPERYPITTGGIVSTSVDLPGTTGGEILDALRPYPSLRGAFGVKQGPLGGEPAGPNDVVVRGPDHKGVLRATIAQGAPAQTNMADWWRRQRELASIVEVDESMPRYPQPHLVGFALPEVGGGPSPFPLLLWWALLLGLSSLARYEPAIWTIAIDLDTSPLAVSLERVLDLAQDRVPIRILQSLNAARD